MKKMKEINNNDQLKGLVFFGFYFIFFVIIIILFRINNGNNTNKHNISSNDLLFITQDSYSFTYKITKDGIAYKYSGDKNLNTEKFEFDGVSYYYDGSKYYAYQFNNWVEVDNPYKYFELLDNKNILLLKDNMMLTNTIKYTSGKIVNHYIVSSNSINKILFNKDTDFFEKGNMISISKNSNDKVEKILLSLDDFCINNGFCNNSLTIDLEYDYSFNR